MMIFDRMTRRRKLDRLIEQWIEYRDMVSRHGGQPGATPEQEKQFLELKASIAGNLPLLHDSLGQGSLNTEAQTNARGMTDLMNSQLSLAGVVPGDDFLNRWHAHYLYLNKFKGIESQARPQHRPAGGVAPASMPGDGYYRGGFVHRWIRPIFDNWLMKLVVRTAVLVGLVLLVARVLNVDLRQAPEWGRRVAADWWGPADTATGPAPKGGKAAQAGSAFQDASRNQQRKIEQGLREAQDGAQGADGEAAAPAQKPADRRAVVINGAPRATRHSVDGSADFTPPATPAIIPRARAFISRITPRPVKEFFSPVTSQYGVEVTVAMVGIGLLLVAYMIFGRAR